MFDLKKLALGTTLALLASAGAANASVIYDLTFTPTSGGSLSGSGQITISTPPLTGLNQQSTYTQSAGTLTALNITFGSDVFNFADKNSGSNPLVRFTSGVIDDITYAGTTANGDSLMITSQFVYFISSSRTQEIGNFTARLDTGLGAAAVPEPLSLGIFGTGLVGAAVMRRRQKAKRA